MWSSLEEPHVPFMGNVVLEKSRKKLIRKTFKSKEFGRVFVSLLTQQEPDFQINKAVHSHTLFAVKPILLFYVGNSLAPVVESMAVQWDVHPQGLQEPSSPAGSRPGGRTSQAWSMASVTGC